MGPQIRNESGESKRNVTCGICNQTGIRDNKWGLAVPSSEQLLNV